MDYMEILQWPAMILTLLGAWMISTDKRSIRHKGFWVFLLSNVLWILWGMHVKAYGVVLMQIGLAIVNYHGLTRTD